MPSKQIDLMPGEELVLYANPHWWYFWKEVLSLLILIGVLILFAVLGWEIGGAISMLFLIVALGIIAVTLYAFVGWKTTRFAITDQRVAYQSGVIQRRGVSIPLNRVNNVNFSQSFIARALNNGVVTIESAGQGDSVFENIPDPEKVRTLIFQQVEVDEQRDSDRDAASLAKAMREHVEPAPSAPSPPSAPERLAALDDLKAQGLVNDTEYAAKRQQILDEL